MRKLIGLDLFAGAGGLALGAELAGIHVALAVEANRHAAHSYWLNHRRTEVLNIDVRKLASELVAPHKKKGQVRILFGGPPCSGFSYSNQQTRSSRNSNNHLYKAFFRSVKIWEPEWIVFENVRGIIDTAGGIFLERILNSLDDLGYAHSHAVLNAADYGVPQRRNRLFIVAGRSQRPLIPTPPKEQRRATVAEAIADLPTLKNGDTTDWRSYAAAVPSQYAKGLRGRLRRCSGHLVTRSNKTVLERYEHVPAGGNWEDIPERLMSNYTDRSRCHTGIYHRLDPDKPSTVLGNFRKNMLIHPKQHRGLSIREAARLQSFPDWYRFFGSIGIQQQQVGNAVPPMLAAHVFESIVRLI